RGGDRPHHGRDGSGAGDRRCDRGAGLHGARTGERDRAALRAGCGKREAGYVTGPLKLGTRGSRLALWQAGWVKAALAKAGGRVGAEDGWSGVMRPCARERAVERVESEGGGQGGWSEGGRGAGGVGGPGRGDVMRVACSVLRIGGVVAVVVRMTRGVGWCG